MSATTIGLVADVHATNGGGGASDIHITNVWARTTPAGARYGAAYLTIASRAGDRLIGASVPHSVAEGTQIHETVVWADSSGGHTPGQMSMRQVESVLLPAGESVQFKPGGYHIMLMELKKPLKAGQHVSLTLTLEKAGKRTVTATVRDE